MPLRQAITTAASVDRSRVTMVRGGCGLVAAGALQAVGGLRFALPSASDGGGAAWQLLGWPIGGVVLLAASVVLAVGWRGEVGLVGRSGRRRAALIVSSLEPLLLIVVFVLVWTVGPTVWGLTFLMLAGVQLLTFAATAVVAATVLRRREVTGAARWAFAGLAVVDAVALLLALVPQTAVAFQVVVAGARPLTVILVGVLLVVAARGPDAADVHRAG